MDEDGSPILTFGLKYRKKGKILLAGQNGLGSENLRIILLSVFASREMTPSAPGETNDGRESFQPLTALQNLLVRSRDEAEEEMFPAAPPSLRAAKKNPYKFHWRRARLSFLFIIFTISLLNFLVLAGPMFRFEAIKKAVPNGCF